MPILVITIPELQRITLANDTDVVKSPGTIIG